MVFEWSLYDTNPKNALLRGYPSKVAATKTWFQVFEGLVAVVTFKTF